MEISNVGTARIPSEVPRATPAEVAGKPLARTEGVPKTVETAAEQTTGKPVRQEDLQKAVEAMNDFVAPMNNALSFSVDKESGQTVVKVIDRETEKIVRQIPSEEALEIARALDKFRGLLIQDLA